MMENFERFEARDSNEKNYKIILKYGKSLETPKWKDFKGVYSSDEMRKDLTYINSIIKKIEKQRDDLSPSEKEIDEENRKRAMCLEIVLTDQIYDGNWFGEEAMTSKTHKYDDIANGVDMIVEFDKEEPERVALTVDASTASDKHVIEKKIRRNMEKLKNRNCLQEIKYFKSQISDANGRYHKGSLRDLIPVVVGANKGNINKLFEIFSELKFLEENKNETTKTRRGELRRELAEDSIQGIFLKEIKLQLETYIRIIGGQDEKVLKKCGSLLKIIDEVIDEKERDGIFNREKIQQDQTLDNIKHVCKDLE